MRERYTSNGKKVNLISQADENNFLVQEILVQSDGKEVLSNTKFIVNQVFDKPVKTSRQLQFERMEEYYKIELETSRKRYQSKRDEINKSYNSLSQFLQNINNISTISNTKDTLIFNVISGKFKYVTHKGNIFASNKKCIYTIEEAIELGLINSHSMLLAKGNSHGSLTFVTNFKEAEQDIQSSISNHNITYIEQIKEAANKGFKVSDSQIKKVIDIVETSRQTQLSYIKTTINDYDKKIEELNNLLSNN